MEKKMLYYNNIFKNFMELRSFVMKTKTIKILFLILVQIALMANFIFATDNIVLSKITGKVRVKIDAASDWENGKEGMILNQQSRVRTFTNSIAELTMDAGKTTFVVRENTEIVVQDYSTNQKTNAKNRDIKVNFGGVKFNVDKLKDQSSSFKISTPSAVCGVRGTEGIISAQGEEKPSQFTLTEGNVFVTDESGSKGNPVDAGNTLMKNTDGSVEFRENRPEDVDDAFFKPIDKKYTDLLEKINIVWTEKRNDGYILTGFEGLKKRAENSFASRQFAKFEKEAAQFLNEIENAKKSENQFAGEYSKAQAEIDNLVKEKFGRFDIENSMLKIKDAEDLYNSAKYKEAVDLLKQIIQELKTAAVKSEFVDLEKQEEEISNEILEKGKAGFIVTEGEILFKNALAAHQSKNFVEVISLLKEARKALALARRKAPEGLDERIKETVKLVETKKEAGLKVDELFIVLQKVQEAFAADKFVEVQNLIDFINKQIAALEGKKIEKKIEITLGDIKYLQKEANIRYYK